MMPGTFMAAVSSLALRLSRVLRARHVGLLSLDWFPKAPLSVRRITSKGCEMKKLLLASGLVLAQAASMHVFAQSDAGATRNAPTPSAQANGEKGTAPAGPKAGVAGTSSPGMGGPSGTAAAGGKAPAPTTESTGEKARMPAERKPATGSSDASGRGSAGERKAAPAPSIEANGEKADRKGGVGEMKPSAPAK
jgi:hypothetical protein